MCVSVCVGCGGVSKCCSGVWRWCSGVSAEGLVKEGVRMSKDNTLMQIRHSVKLEGEPWEVEVIE